MNKDMFAPPTAEELQKATAPVQDKMFAPPTAEELKGPEQESLATNVEDTLKGAGEGATLNFGDELLAGLKAGGETLHGRGTLADIADRYRKYQLENEASANKSKERSPYLYGAGELAGGMAAAGPLGLAEKGLTLGQLAARGAAASGAAALGGTEGSIADHPEEALKNTAFGTAAGAVLPVAVEKALIPAAKGVTGYVGDLIGDSPVIRQHVKSFTQGLEGQGFTGEKNQDIMGNAAKSVSNDLQSKLQKGQELVQDKYTKVLNTDINLNPEEIKGFDTIRSIFQKSADKTGVPNELQTTLDAIKSGTVKAQDLKSLQKMLRDMGSNIVQSGDLDQIAIGKALVAGEKNAKNILNNLDGYSDVNSLYGKFQEPVESFLTNTPSKNLGWESTVDPTKSDTKIFTNARQAVEKSALPFLEGKKQYEQLGELKSGFEDLAKTAQGKEILDQMGITDIPKYFKDFKNQADIQAIHKIIAGTGGLNKSNELLGSGLKGTYFGANILGQVAGRPFRALGMTGKNSLPELSRQLYKASPEQLTEVSGALKTTMPWLSQKLDEAIQNKSQAGINSALFIIMQNPNARKAVFGDSETDTKQSIPGVVK